MHNTKARKINLGSWKAEQGSPQQGRGCHCKEPEWVFLDPDHVLVFYRALADFINFVKIHQAVPLYIIQFSVCALYSNKKFT